MNLTDDQKRKIWSVLVQMCGARPRQWDEFEHHFPQCREFRFQGDLGYGGKVWADRDRVYVNCYAEDATTERTAAIEQANAELATLGPPGYRTVTAG